MIVNVFVPPMVTGFVAADVLVPVNSRLLIVKSAPSVVFRFVPPFAANFTFVADPGSNPVFVVPVASLVKFVDPLVIVLHDPVPEAPRLPCQ